MAATTETVTGEEVLEEGAETEAVDTAGELEEETAAEAAEETAAEAAEETAAEAAGDIDE